MTDVGPLIDLANMEGISILTIERFIPTGSGLRIKNEMLNPTEIETIFNYVSKRANDEISQKGSTIITRSRPLWTLTNTTCSYSIIDEKTK